MGKVDLKLASILRAHSLIAIDTPVFIYHFEDNPRYRDLTVPLFEAIESGACKAVTSVLSRLEILVRPLRENRPDIADSYRFLIDTFPNLTQVPVDEEVADRAAELRAGSGLATPDSIHLACALTAEATLLVTNDADFLKEKVDELEFLILDSLI